MGWFSSVVERIEHDATRARDRRVAGVLVEASANVDIRAATRRCEIVAPVA